jgi:hypothetical protein
LVAALILAVILCVVSFTLLLFPAIAGYYYAVWQSKREEYFIDLNNIFRTTFLVFSGIRRFFVQSYLFGIIGLLPAALLFLAPILPWIVTGEETYTWIHLILQILWLPSFFLAGAVVLYGYPCLINTNSAIGSFRHALSIGKARPFKTLVLGFLLLFPIPGFVFHLLVVITYPLLVSWALSGTFDHSERLIRITEKEKPVLPEWLFYIFMVMIFAAGCYLFYKVWGGVGIVGWLGLCLTFYLTRILSTWNYALRLFGSVIGFTVVTLGGGSLFARLWGDKFFFIWTGICMLLLMLFFVKLAKSASKGK